MCGCMMRKSREAAAHFCLSRLHKPGRPWELITSNRIAHSSGYFLVNTTTRAKWKDCCRYGAGENAESQLATLEDRSFFLVGQRNTALSEIYSTRCASTLLKRHAFQNSLGTSSLSNVPQLGRLSSLALGKGAKCFFSLIFICKIRRCARTLKLFF